MGNAILSPSRARVVDEAAKPVWCDGEQNGGEDQVTKSWRTDAAGASPVVSPRPSTSSLKTWACLAALAGLGLAGNYFSLPLLLGADFIFGSVAALIAVSLFGTLAGTAVAAIASLYTLVLWSQPYAALTFTAEAAFVGLLRRRTGAPLVVLDGLFWLFLGVPMVWVLYPALLHMDTVATLMIALKEAVNGIFNALVASLVVSYWPRPGRARTAAPLREKLFTLMVALVLFPGLFAMTLDGRRTMHDSDATLAEAVRDTAADVGGRLTVWLEGQLAVIRALAEVAAASDPAPAGVLQHDTELAVRSAPDLAAAYVADAAGTTRTFWPATDARGERTVGLNFADRGYYGRVRETLRPVVSDAFVARGGISVPTTALAVPVLRGGLFRGLAVGALDLSRIVALLEAYGEPDRRRARTLDVTVVDTLGHVIASSVAGRRPLSVFRRAAAGHVVRLGDGLSRWAPDDPTLPSVTRWKRSFYVHDAPISAEVPWRLIVEAPLAPLQRSLYQGYIRSLAILSGLIALTLVLSALFSRWLVRPLGQLAELTTDLPQILLDDNPIAWPKSTATELERLVANFRAMARSLQQNLQELRLRTQELGDAKDEIEAIFDSVTDPTFVLDRDRQVLRANRALADLVGARLPDLPGRAADGVIDGLVDPCESGTLAEAFRTGRPAEEERWSPAGAVYKIHFFPVAARARVESVVVRLQDVTEARELEHRLRQSEKLASIGQLAAGVAHEINNPVGFIVSGMNRLLEYAQEIRDFGEQQQALAETVLGGDRDPREAWEKDRALREETGLAFLTADVVDVATECREGAERIRQIVADLRTFSHVDGPGPQYADLNEGLESTLNIAANELKYRCEVVRDYGELPPVLCLPQQLNQVFLNLLVNAAQAIPERGTVTTRTRAEDDRVLISVSDTGVGIAPEHLPKIFDPFFTTKPVGQGTGLGLHLAHGIVHRHGGEIRVESQPGCGSTFTVVLPTIPAELSLAG